MQDYVVHQALPLTEEEQGNYCGMRDGNWCLLPLYPACSGTAAAVAGHSGRSRMTPRQHVSGVHVDAGLTCADTRVTQVIEQ